MGTCDPLEGWAGVFDSPLYSGILLPAIPEAPAAALLLGCIGELISKQFNENHEASGPHTPSTKVTVDGLSSEDKRSGMR